MDPAGFLLDASVFIQAARTYYAFDLAPSFWDVLRAYAESGSILSIDRVRDELTRGKDQLALWAEQRGNVLFVSTDAEDIVESYREVITWVYRQAQFYDAAKYKFANGADGWLVAYARVRGCVVVTQEAPAKEAKKKVPLPNVCEGFGVTFLNTFDMLRSLGVQFVEARLPAGRPRRLETA